MSQESSADLPSLSLIERPGATPRLALRAVRDGVSLAAEVDLDAAAAPAAPRAAAEGAATEEQRLQRANLPRRARLALAPAFHALRHAAHWLLTSREDTNYTYDLTARNRLHLEHVVALVAGRPVTEIRRYCDELMSDDDLRRHVQAIYDQLLPRERAVSDREPRYARRIGWYALVRALKPRLVVETGIDKGLGSVVLCAALRRNAAEGAAGRYVGTDIRPEAGHLLRPPYADVGEVRYGDSLASLAQIADPIDLFINDSDHSAAYEGQEYATIAPRLSAQAVIVGDNAYATDELAAFAERTGRRFVFWREQPAAHFYPGAGIGFAFR